jgi:hypothetical protein
MIRGHRGWGHFSNVTNQESLTSPIKEKTYGKMNTGKRMNHIET